MVSYYCPIVTSFFVHKTRRFEIIDFKNAVTLKPEIGVREGHSKCYI